MRLLPFLLLAACEEEPLDPALLPVDDAPPPVTVTVVGSCPGPVTVNLAGITPFAPWALAGSPQLAPGVIVPGGPCAGMALRIGPPASLVASGTASAAGTASFGAVLPPAACGWYIQPADLSLCMTGMYLQL